MVAVLSRRPGACPASRPGPLEQQLHSVEDGARGVPAPARSEVEAFASVDALGGISDFRHGLEEVPTSCAFVGLAPTSWWSVLPGQALPPDVAANRARVWVAAATLIGAVLDRAEARGELPVGIDRRLTLETLIGPLQVWLLLSREPFDDAYHEQIVDVVLGGLAAAAPRAASGPAAPRRRS